MLESLYRQEPRRRKPSAVIAFMLGILAPGMGHLYAGELRRGIAGFFLVIALAGLAFQASFSLSDRPLGVALTLPLVFAPALLLATDAALQARRKGELSRSRFDRWYVYIAWFLLTPQIASPMLKVVAPALPFRIFEVPTSSMLPTLIAGDLMVARMHSFDPGDVSRGEVVVFEAPFDRSILYIKRIVGLPGEVVQIRDMQVLIDGEILEEPYKVHEYETNAAAWALLSEGRRIGQEERATFEQKAGKPPVPVGPIHLDWGPFLVPQGTVFVLGDNRDNSKDSRVYGAVPLANLRGHVVSVYLSSPPERPLAIRWHRVGVAVE